MYQKKMYHIYSALLFKIIIIQLTIILVNFFMIIFRLYVYLCIVSSVLLSFEQGVMFIVTHLQFYRSHPTNFPTQSTFTKSKMFLKYIFQQGFSLLYTIGSHFHLRDLLNLLLALMYFKIYI